MVSALRDHPPSYNTIKLGVAKFKRGRTDIKILHHDGRPVSVITPEYIDAVHDMILHDRRTDLKVQCNHQLRMDVYAIFHQCAGNEETHRLEGAGKVEQTLCGITSFFIQYTCIPFKRNQRSSNDPQIRIIIIIIIIIIITRIIIRHCGTMVSNMFKKSTVNFNVICVLVDSCCVADLRPFKTPKIQEIATGVPVIIRWGAWLNGALCYATYYKEVKTVIDVLYDNESSSIPIVKFNNMPYFRFAPITSCDVERSFSLYKKCFTEKKTDI
ncbi:hypothetical protein ANN_03120 [Periplaneta americana]|uniref:Uncharacterized protein n=1 Tax=Periplaneta americana TaxID=6978 RepID=A0ABQ8U0S9_PERAM|nr:hypothetical protein ANN_03120 [Periplaneta americana]